MSKIVDEPALFQKRHTHNLLTLPSLYTNSALHAEYSRNMYHYFLEHALIHSSIAICLVNLKAFLPWHC